MTILFVMATGHHKRFVMRTPLQMQLTSFRPSICIAVFMLTIGWSPIDVIAQSGTVSGVVIDLETGETLAGANVFVVGTQIGRSTDIRGRYTMDLPVGSHVLQASFVGFKANQQTVSITSGASLEQNFSLEADLVGVDEIVVIGTRRSGRTVIESPVPVDVLTPEELESTGLVETTQILAALIPSYNAPQASITDGSDHVRPATLRGLGPDQVLILVNGKRRHTSALVHVNGSVGRGSTGVDLNAIPSAMIERVEVLRDGAAAQYGSDAIAGVINIVLKERQGLDANVTLGQNYSIVDRGYAAGELLREGEDADSFTWDGDGDVGPIETVTHTDGKTANLNLGYGVDVGKGNIYVGGSLRHRDHSNRAGLDPRQQYYDGDPNSNEAAFNRLNHRFGNGQFDDLTVFVNGSVPVANDRAQAYVFGGASAREGLSGCFFRRSLDNRTNRSLYPNGFLPKINAKVNDLSLAGGVKGNARGWSYDVSETFGGNDFTFNMTDTHNASMDNSRTEMDAGTLKFLQSTTNADLFRSVEIGTAAPLSIAVGGEFRFENYQIDPGDPDSFEHGGVDVRDGPNAGAATAAGSQCFPGFQPASSRDETRTNFGFYVDLENNVTSQFLIGLAGRFENYSDFGSTVTGKLASRFELTPELALRGAVSTGFRAPSLAQAWFTSIATNFIDGVPFEVGTFPVESEVAQALGAQKLDPEKSLNVSGGATYGSDNATVSVDGYLIEIDDRITFTENFTDDAVAQFLDDRGIGATGGRYFTNAIDTRTKGIDVTGRLATTIGEGVARFTTAINFNETEVKNKNTDGAIAAPQELIDLNEPLLVDGARLGDYEVAQPKNKLNFQGNYEYDNWKFMARTVRYGEVTSVSNTANRTETFGAKWITDVEVGYAPRYGVLFAVGSTNVLDVYPDKQLKVNSFNGIFPYDGFSPFGFFGRYVYARLSVQVQ